MLVISLFIVTLFLAYSNGANDNIKGVATLYGCGALSYRPALAIATIATFLGSISAIFLAQALISRFSGNGLVTQDLAGTPHFLIAVGFSAACTVFIATRSGFPISTTHSLIGGLLGAGLMATGLQINLTVLGEDLFLPLLLSPFLAFALSIIVYWIFTQTRQAVGLTKEKCICIGEAKQLAAVDAIARTDLNNNPLASGSLKSSSPTITIAEDAECAELYTDRVWGMSLQKLLDIAHIISAAMVSFARGLNDTPKIAGLLVAVQAYDISLGMLTIATAMAIGGLLNSRRVAQTISKDITTINHGQGFSANLVTSFLVIIASKFGIPVSTTHVSVGSIFGIGLINKNYNTRVISNIVLSWLITLPIAMAISALVYWLIS